jgi:ADP-heptose:LPS heptosyltransferase
MLANLEIFLDNPLEIIEYSTKNISKRYHDEAKRLLPDNNYIGFSVTQGNEYRRKGWHIDKFINLAKKCISDGKRIVFFC